MSTPQVTAEEIPPIAPGLQSRRGITSVPPSARHENSTINA